ncbi:MAG: alpha/beta fold hydrolase [Alphaproteobacteria bacterium]
MVVWDGARSTFMIAGKRLEYQTFGLPPEQAPTILLLHEGLGCLSLWRDFPEQLAEATGLGVFAWSRAGYGQSEPAGRPWSFDYMYREAVVGLPEVLDMIGFQEGILLGHSDGASIAAIHVGDVRDARVQGLVVMAPHFFTESDGQSAIAATREVYQSGKLRERLSRYHQDPAFLNWNIEACIDGFNVPTLAIQGADDEFGTLAHIEAIKRRSLKPVRRLVLPDCKHAPHLEKAEETLSGIQGFIEGELGLRAYSNV